MRVLMIHNRYQQRGGEDMVVEQEVNMLREQGITVEILFFTNENFADLSGIDLLRAGFQTIHNQASVHRVESVVETFRPDVVHIHNLFYTASPAIILAVKRMGVPVVMTLHNYRLVCSGGFLIRAGQVPCERCVNQILPLDGIRLGCFRNSSAQTAQLTLTTAWHKAIGTWQRVDRFIVLTEFARQKILKSSLKLRPEQVVVKPNAVPDLGYAGSAEREDFFLFIGRLSPEKGIKTLLDATQQLPLNVEILGDGPLRNDVEKVAKACPTIQFLGHQPRSVVVERLKKCRAVVIPSLWHEGLPTVMLEALATGTPVIYSDQANLQSIMGTDGICFRSGDADALATVMTRLSITPPTEVQHRQLRNRYEEQYTVQRIYDRQYALYESLMQTPVLV